MSMPTLLIASCNPPDNKPLQVERIVRNISEILRDRAIEIELAPDLHFEDIGPRLRRHRPFAFQFIGHGVGDGRLMMKRQDGVPRDVAASAVVGAMAEAGPLPALVLLTACHSRPLAEALVKAGASCVVGTTERVPDDALDAFSRAFYRAIVEGRSVAAAFRAGQAAVAGETEGMDDRFALVEAREGAAESLRLDLALSAPAQPTVEVPIAARDVAQAVVWLDLDDVQPAEAEIERRLPSERRGVTYHRLSEHGGPRLDRDRQPEQVPWSWIRRAIASLGRQLRAQAATDGRPLRYYVVGRAPLAAFVQLGAEMTGWSQPVTLLNQRKDGRWDEIALDGPVSPWAFFDRTEGLSQPHDAQGRLHLFVSCNGDVAPAAARDFTPPDGGARAGVVTLSTSVPKFVDETNGPRIQAELAQASTQLRARWPGHDRVALFVAGSATLAFMVGRALNVKMSRFLATDYVHGKYLPALSLPLDASEPAPVDYDEPRGKHERLRILHRLRDAVGTAARQLQPVHLRPPAVLVPRGSTPDREGERLRRRLVELEFSPEPGDEAFSFSTLRRKMQIGAGFLEGMRGLPDATLDRLGPLFVLHELLHPDQGLSGRIYRGVGRAGFALEEVDALADAYALAALARLAIDRGGVHARERAGELLCELIDAHVAAMMAFDRLEHGQRIDELPERRLRRYLIWAIQHARAATARSPDDVERILADRVVVELAPLRSTLDGRFDKIVLDPTDHTELFIVVDGRLLRVARRPENFAPADLIAAVRALDWSRLRGLAETLVELEQRALAPWVDDT